MPETRVDPSFEQLLEFVRASRGFDYLPMAAHFDPPLNWGNVRDLG